MPDPDRVKSSRSRPPGGRERRALPGSQRGVFAALRRLHALMTRPFRIVWADGGLRLRFVERRDGGGLAVAAAAAPAVDPLVALRAELRARLLEFAPRDAAQVMHHLLLVDQELGRKGWAGVEALPAPVLAQALVQAQRLVRERPSVAVASVIDRLRPLLAAAEQRGHRDERHRATVTHAQLEISEASGEDFEASKRSWFGELAPAEPPPEPRPGPTPGEAGKN